MSKAFEHLLSDVRACTICQGLPLGPKPILQAQSTARILIAGQAPGRITHAKGRPFDDPSGERLRAWMGITRDVFYDPEKIAIVPMGFCYPGTAKGGDLPPRTECAPAWREKIMTHLPAVQLTLVIGQYAQSWHLDLDPSQNLTARVRNWRDHWPRLLPLPHPSPRNGIWLKANPWFAEDVLPVLKARISKILA